MDSLPRPDVILTHESDLDGFVSGLLLQRLARHLHQCDVTLEAHHYHSWKLREPRERAAWVSDFTFEARIDRPNWVAIDHHPTEVTAKKAIFIHDTSKSAGSLVYDLCRQHGLNSEALDRVVHLNNVADLFLEGDADFIAAHDYANLVKTYNFWNLHALIEGKLENLIDHPLLEVMATKRKIEDPLGYEWSRKHVVGIGSGLGFVDTVVGNNNLIVHRLLEQKATPYPVLMTLFRKANGAMVVSFRSRNGEALKIAERLQGGGHPNACGATLPRSVKSVPDSIDYLRGLFGPAQAEKAALNSLESLFNSIEVKTS